MHGMEEFRADPNDLTPNGKAWWQELNRYHWFVLLVAALGWLFDCLDQQLFVLARPSAMKDLLPPMDDPEAFKQSVQIYGNYATSIFLAGWALGGVVFGMLGDRWGRAKTMMITILMYSACTGLSALSTGFWDFAFYRFLTGLGVGGEFAVGVALVAEVMPARARPRCLSVLQALSAIGNISAAFIFLGLGVAEEQGMVDSPWRIMFVIGAVPALLALVIRRGLKEPEQWQQSKHDDAVKKQLGSYTELFRDPVLKKHALLGLVLACSGVIGLWAVGFFTPDLMNTVQRRGVTAQVYQERLAEAQAAKDTALVEQWQALIALNTEKEAKPTPEQAALKADAEKAIAGRLKRWGSITSMMINIGAFFGMFGFGWLSERIGRKPTFAMGFIAAFLSTASVFWFLRDFSQLFWLVPIMGFCQLSLFAGYAMYFPELFPTRLRSTGTSFCYNVGRFVAAIGPLIQVQLIKLFAGQEESMRLVGVVMSFVFLVGLFVLPFLPETRGKPLPE